MRGYAIGAVVLLSACSGAGGESTTQTIGAEGGTVDATGVSLIIPAGALSAEAAIAVTETGDAAPDGLERSSPVFRFEPAGLQFALPVEVRIDAGTDAAAALYWTVAGGDAFVGIDSALTDGWVIGEVDHFSRGFAGHAAPDQPDAGDDAPDAGSGVCGDGVTQPPEECDDGDSTPGDGCENDCTASADSDTDGYADSVDCAPQNMNIHPGASEICHDCVDNNCSNGTDDGCATTQCNDGADNDGDDAVDYPADGDCACATDSSEGALPSD